MLRDIFYNRWLLSYTGELITMKHNTKRQQKSWFRILSRSPSSPVEDDGTKISISSLKKLAVTKEQKDILQRIEHETIPTVRDAWIDYFLEKTKPSEE